MEEVEKVLSRIGLQSSQFSAVSTCPEGKPLIYVTLLSHVNIDQFTKRNESYVVKPGICTTTIRPAGKRDVGVTVCALHPNTQDAAVIRYLSAHGKVNMTDPVIYDVYPGAPGSSLLAGKQNNNRIYMVELHTEMGSYHIIEGEKVSVRYRGQVRTCAKCHQVETVCSSFGKARDCEDERVLLSENMQQHWNKIGYKPETPEGEDVNEVEGVEPVNLQLSTQTGDPGLLASWRSIKFSETE